jgi:ATP/maltotriose-dependent transcriptional regulator MalT/DNA-binding SARP family transcriptional activator
MAGIAKVSRPRMPDVAPRERLFVRLDQVLAGASAWISGPPGSGKTTLVASYLDARQVRAIWYQVDDGDADLASFFHYLTMAAAEVGVAAREVLPVPSPESLRDLPGFARRYFRALWQHLPKPLAFVLDNFQEVPDGAPLHAVLRDALADLPADLAAIVISRHGPAAELARQRANRLLRELEWPELRLTLDEARAIARAARAQHLDGIEALVARCDGWAAGLVLLLGSARPAGAQSPESRQALFDYFAGELFDRLPHAMQRMLLATCLPPWVDAAMAHALAGDARAADMLEELRRKRLFIELRDGPQRSFQYHPLFREFLQARLQAQGEPAARAALARRSAELLAQAGEPGAAIDLFLLAGASGDAARIILALAQELVSQGRHQTLEMWIERLPAGVIEGLPWLMYWQALGRFPIDLAEARRRLELAFDRFSAAGDSGGKVSTALGIIEAIYLQHFAGVGGGSAERWIDALDRALRQAPSDLDPGLGLDACAGLLREGVMTRPDRARVDHWVALIKALIPKAGVNQAVQAALAALNYLECLGVTAELRDLIARVQPLIEHPHLSPALRGQWLANEALSEIFFLDNEARAFAQLRQAQELARENGVHSIKPYVSLTSALAHLSVGDVDGAKRQLAAIASLQGPLQGPIESMQGAVAALEGRIEDGLEQVRRGYARMRASDSWLMHLGASVYLATIEAIGGNYEAAIAAAAVNRSLYSSLEDGGRLYHAAFAEAFARLKLGDEAAAAALLTEQLAAWRRQGVATCILFSPAIFAPLFAFALERGIERHYVEHLIKRRRLSPVSLDTEDWPWPVRVRALGRFELAVNGQPLPRTRKAPRKLLLVLKTITALGGEDVPEDRLADLLWPDQDGDVARDLLATSLLRLRRLLGRADAIAVHDARVSLAPEIVWTDVRSFERLADEAARAPASAADATRRAIALFRGKFLRDEPDLAGAHEIRDRLSSKFLRLVSRRAAQLEDLQDHAAAAALFDQAIDAEPSIEAFHEGLARCSRARRARTAD